MNTESALVSPSTTIAEEVLAYVDQRYDTVSHNAPEVPYGGPYYGYHGEDLSVIEFSVHRELGKIVVLGCKVQAGDAPDGAKA